MDAPFKKGSAVRQAIKPISGTVKSVVFDDDNGQFKYLIEYELETDGNPDTKDMHTRWFLHKELEAVPEPEAT